MQDREAGNRVSLISNAILFLLRGCAVISKAICLNHQTEGGPVEVDSVSVQPYLRLRRWKIGLADQAKKTTL